MAVYIFKSLSFKKTVFELAGGLETKLFRLVWFCCDVKIIPYYYYGYGYF